MRMRAWFFRSTLRFVATEAMPSPELRQQVSTQTLMDETGTESSKLVEQRLHIAKGTTL